MSVMLSLLLFFFAFLAVFAILREHNRILLFRVVALIFAIAVIAMFNINWLTGLAIKEWSWVFLFMGLFVLALIIKKKNIFLEIINISKKYWRAYIFSVAVFLTAVFLASSYFHWNLNVPRYSTPDSGTHFLYMQSTAENGMMALFGKNLIEEASGDATIAPGHNATYFPGATAVFAFLETLLSPRNPAMTLQFFNIVCYGILSGYFILLFYTRGMIRKKITLAALTVIILLGSFFNLVATSHSTQLLGLLFLIAFIDFFETYLQKKESLFPVALTFGAMITTYFYWLPIALAFVAIRIFFLNLQGKNFLRGFLNAILPLATGFVFCVGYVIVMFKLNMFQYSSADGGVAFQGQLLSDTMIVAPFAVLQLFSLLRNWKTNSENKKFTAAFFVGVGVFALLLAVFYKNGVLVSHYTAMKVLYLVVPATWVLIMMFFEENHASIKMFFVGIFKKELGVLKIFRKQLTVIGLLFLWMIMVSYIFEVGFNFLPLMQKNIKIVLNNEKSSDLSAEQMELLDDVRINHADLLQDGKIFIIGPDKNVLWAFAYSGIWPRSDSLVTTHAGNYSELNFSYSSVDDYANWLKQDERHILIYFNANEIDQCTDCNMFNIDDYKKLEVRGDNYLLELKNDANPVYDYREAIVTKKSDRVTLPVIFSFSSTDDFLAGISLRLQVNPKRDVRGDVVLEIFKGDCLKEVKVKEASVIIKKEDIIKKGDRRTVKVYFEKDLPDAKDTKWCIHLSSADEKTSAATGIGRYSDGSYDAQPIYTYFPRVVN